MRTGIDKNLKWNENIRIPTLPRDPAETCHTQLLKLNLAWPKKNPKLGIIDKPKNGGLASSTKLSTV